MEEYYTEIIDTLNDIDQQISFQNDYILYQRDQIRLQNSLILCILVFVGACLGALIFRHLRK